MQASPYPLTSFFFAVTIVGTDREDAAFQEASGLRSEREVVEVAEGGENRYVHRLPGGVKHGNLVLKRGMVGRATALYDWCKDAVESDLGLLVRPRDIQVSLLDPDENPVASWDFVRAWPVTMGVSDFNAERGEVAVETLEFAFAYLRRGYKGAGLGGRRG